MLPSVGAAGRPSSAHLLRSSARAEPAAASAGFVAPMTWLTVEGRGLRVGARSRVRVRVTVRVRIRIRVRVRVRVRVRGLGFGLGF